GRAWHGRAVVAGPGRVTGSGPWGRTSDRARGAARPVDGGVRGRTGEPRVASRREAVHPGRSARDRDPRCGRVCPGVHPGRAPPLLLCGTPPDATVHGESAAGGGGGDTRE